MVTAYADMESAIAAVNSGAVYKYLTKPIDLAQTKQVLTDAMAAFAAAKQRDAALNDQGSMMQRMIVADRVRSMAALATGVSHHVRNSLTAMNCFFEELGEKVSAAVAAKGAAGAGPFAVGGDNGYLDELLALANKERERLVGMVRDVEARGARPKFNHETTVDLAELVTTAATTAGVPVQVDVAAGVATVHADAPAMTRMLQTLIVHAQRYSTKGATVRITAEAPVPHWNTTGVRLRILGDGAWEQADVDAFFTPFAITTKTPGDVGLELLDAFQTALGHEADLVAHRAAPAGPGFEVHLPLDPATVRRPALVDGQLKMAV
jgi:K+-sensing histidine kinase KdpD